MRKLNFILALLLVTGLIQAQDLKYYLPDSVVYDPRIPTPKEIINHEVGEWHITHDRLVNYMKAIATAAPERVKLETMGATYEGRPQVLLIFTSPKNHQRLEEIRKIHLRLTDPHQASTVDINKQPIVVWIGNSIHGNEPSGANAALLCAYYLAAAQGKAIDDLLENEVILLDPSFNPDGLQRFSTWANQHRSKNLVSDPNSREFNEVWPGGRFNHYWFDLNRDWLPAIHVESKNRLKWFHSWKPNILTDHHEQGSNNTFFFQPGIPSRVNPLTPAANQELTTKLATFHAAYLDRIGSLYFTKESYDDFYYGKGSTYADINGGIGVLFEQASSRGHLQQTANGLLSFPFTIRNQFVTMLSTLEGARVLRKDFLEYQLHFFKNEMADANADPVKGYVFGGSKNSGAANEFAKMLVLHGAEVFNINKEINIAGRSYNPSNSFVVSLNQSSYKVIKTIFSKTLEFKDSLFYDISSWTMPLAFGINTDELNELQLQLLSLKKWSVTAPHKISLEPAYAYLLEWNEMLAPAVLYEILSEGIVAKVATNSFQLNRGGSNKKYSSGTILIPAQQQKNGPGELRSILQRIALKYDVPIDEVQTGASVSGIDLGSSRFIALTKPSVAMIVGPGTNATDAGEVWHLMDQRMNIPSTHLDVAVFNRIDLNKYNTLIMVGGTYTDMNKDKVKAWVQNGGTLILSEEAVTWASQNGISDVKLKRSRSAVDSASRLSYTDREQIDGAQQIQGAIFGADIDLNHPLSFGYEQKTVSLFKANRVFLEKSRNPYATPFYYGNNPLQSGWVSRENIEAIKNSAAVIVNTVGTGRIINIADNPNFRAFWLGGTKLFMNAIFFGRIIDPASGRTDD